MGGCKRRRPAPASLRRATNAPADSAAGGRKPPKFPRAKYGAEYRTKKQKQLLKKGRFGFLRNALFIAASNGLNCRPVYPGKKKPRFRAAFRLIRHILLYIRSYYIRRRHFRKIYGKIPQKVGFFSKFANPKPLLHARACARVCAYCAKGAKNLGACLLTATHNRAAEVARRCKTASNPAQFFAARAEGKLSRAKSKSKFAAIPQLFRSLPPASRNIRFQAHLSEGDCACEAIARFKVQ